MIGQSLHSDESFEYAQQHLDGGAFTCYGEVWRVMVALWHEEVHASPAAVALRLDRPIDWLDRAPTVPWSAFELAVDRVAAVHRRNRLAFLGADLTRRALDPTEDEGRIVADVAASLEATDLSETPVAPTTLATFLGRVVEYDWIVPGVLERGDRVVITGIEGSGKVPWFASGR